MKSLKEQNLERDQANYDMICVGAMFGRRDGSMSPLAALLSYRHKAIELGATYLTAEVGRMCHSHNQITGIELTSGDVIQALIVVNAAGAWVAKLTQTAGVNLPIQPSKRQVFVIEVEYTHFDHILPMLLLPNGQYLLSIFSPQRLLSNILVLENPKRII
ncbi:MAG: FAD-binding oxidoreductase [Anaerolineales bacterium]|nr:FAD-binding oxidoreductase [Anaerolineales bacterium]